MKFSGSIVVALSQGDSLLLIGNSGLKMLNLDFQASDHCRQPPLLRTDTLLFGSDLLRDQLLLRPERSQQGSVHIRTIGWNHGAIRGWRSLSDDGVEPLLELSQIVMNNDCMLQRGFVTLRPATLREKKALHVFGAWGFEIIKLLAEDYFVKKQPPERKLPWQEYIELLEAAEKSVQALESA